MATKEVKVCDVMLTSGPTVSSYVVQVVDLAAEQVIVDEPVDLSSRALKRLLNLINRGIKPTAQLQRKVGEAQAESST